MNLILIKNTGKTVLFIDSLGSTLRPGNSILINEDILLRHVEIQRCISAGILSIVKNEIVTPEQSVSHFTQSAVVDVEVEVNNELAELSEKDQAQDEVVPENIVESPVKDVFVDEKVADEVDSSKKFKKNKKSFKEDKNRKAIVANGDTIMEVKTKVISEQPSIFIDGKPTEESDDLNPDNGDIQAGDIVYANLND